MLMDVAGLGIEATTRTASPRIVPFDIVQRQALVKHKVDITQFLWLYLYLDSVSLYRE
jgi:hypothetical protein